MQFASKMGFKTVAIARGADKGPLAKKLGAHIYIDSTAQNAAEELTKLGGAKVILATVTDAPSMSAVIAGLGIDGKLVVLGASGEPISICRYCLSAHAAPLPDGHLALHPIPKQH